MLGPYDWEPPIYWETDTDWIAGGAWGFATEISPGASPPPLDSLVKFIPPDHLWPIDDYWNYHAASKPPFDLTLFNKALDARYGPSFSVSDYAEKAQVAAYESHRAMFEAYGRHKYEASGLIQWMMRNGWPSMIWHLYDWYLRPGGAYYGVKHAMEPLHLQYSYDDKTIVLVNSSLKTFSHLSAKASVYDLHGQQQYTNTVTVGSVEVDSVRTLFTLDYEPPKDTQPTTYFLRLSLVDSQHNPVSTQTYWLSTTPDVVAWDTTDWWGTLQSAYADYTALDSLPPPTLKFSDLVLDSTCALGSDTPANEHRVTVSNGGDGVAFFVHIKITKGADGEEILPVLWEDNYFTLFPGESRTVAACYAKADLGDAQPVVHLDTYND
jgi:exo-1,4-beta-D-glucosaminidase